MDISGIDLFIVVAYLIAIPIFGVYFKKYVKTEEDYFLAGKMLPWWVISMSIIGTNIGAYDYMGAAGGAYRFGIAHNQRRQAMSNFSEYAPSKRLSSGHFIRCTC